MLLDRIFKKLSKKRDEKMRKDFVEEYFTGEEFQEYRRELDLESTFKREARDHSRGFDNKTLEILYAIVRKKEPSNVIETGVCNGFSSGVILQALEDNGNGTLHSIDLPFYSDQSLEEFREKTFEGYGGACIPAEKEPGWVFKDKLGKRWDFREGKSQLLLPSLIQELDSCELFLHDSEHSEICMLFEWEMIWQNFERATILSHDISWNDAWPTFSEQRNPDYVKKISKDFGIAE